ncbi:MAG: aldo/keto reductase family protein [Ignavibacteria bacterium]|jgi:voltage-dependent potassium channel beta subunit|nr:aldo/keto reductase family protein [Ignavibacteria bacterium]
MKYRNLGKCGAKVSVISLGSWLTIGGTVDNKRSGNLIKLGFEKGINFFDTADVYNYGMAEITLGKSLKDFRRQDLFIASKCFGKMSDEPNDKGLSRKHIFESVHKSLKNLKTDYIDLYQCHRYDPDTTLEETCRAFNTMIEQGKILYWGVSEWSKDEIKNALEICEKYNLHKPVSNQPQYSLFSRDIESNGVQDICRENGIGLVVWSPLAQGVLTGKYNKKKIENDSRLKDKKNNAFVKNFVNDENLNKVGELIKLSEKTGISVSNLALAWCLRDETVSSAITSATKESQLKENIKASETELTEEILTEIEKIFKSAK